jgi:poly(beta-D-mannuronate) lyase
MKHLCQFFILIAILSNYTVFGKCIKVSNISMFNQEVKTLVPGDSIVFANGIWKDVQIVFNGKGEKGKFIYLTAETAGKVTLEGSSCLKLSGEWLHISGLSFINGHAPKKSVIEFRTGSKEYAYNCVLTNCVIDGFNQEQKETEDHWIDVWGKRNTIEYCYFGGKTNGGTTLVIWPNDENCSNNGNHIYRNYFGYRPPLGVNGGETIRIGTSQVNKNVSASLVEGNYFERCNGEVEIISNKSGGNTYLNNTFFECEGSLTLRHGNDAVVAGNWFIGNGKKNTGGVRVINEGHQIYNNFFYQLRGEDSRSALSIMNGIPDSPDNGYAPVKHVTIANNTFAYCALPWNFCTGAGDRNRIITPETTLLVNNLVYSPDDNEIIVRNDKSDGITLENNLMITKKGSYNTEGSVPGEVMIKKTGDFEIPYALTNAKKMSFITHDILGRYFDNMVIGAFQNPGKQKEIETATSLNCGPAWYKPGL